MPEVMTIDAEGIRGQGRPTPLKPVVQRLEVFFNGEILKASVMVMDAREPEERHADMSRGSGRSAPIVFFPGHAQRPDDAVDFARALARYSACGVVVVPVCDTPYGEDPSFWGDAGKDVVLMEVVAYACSRLGFRVKGARDAEQGMKATVVGDEVRPVDEGAAQAQLALVGWSHGGLLARRFSHAHRDSVVCLGQVCPAGYAPRSALGLAARFLRESAGMAARAGRAWPFVVRSAWGFAKGMAGDFARSVGGAVRQKRPEKVLRVVKDIRDCAVLAEGSRFTAQHLERVAVIFAEHDTCMDPHLLLGIAGSPHVSEAERERFVQRFFPDIADPARVSLRILPGTHAAPVTHPRLYAAAVLAGMGCLAHGS